MAGLVVRTVPASAVLHFLKEPDALYCPSPEYARPPYRDVSGKFSGQPAPRHAVPLHTVFPAWHGHVIPAAVSHLERPVALPLPAQSDLSADGGKPSDCLYV